MLDPVYLQRLLKPLLPLISRRARVVPFPSSGSALPPAAIDALRSFFTATTPDSGRAQPRLRNPTRLYGDPRRLPLAGSVTAFAWHSCGGQALVPDLSSQQSSQVADWDFQAGTLERPERKTVPMNSRSTRAPARSAPRKRTRLRVTTKMMKTTNTTKIQD